MFFDVDIKIDLDSLPQLLRSDYLKLKELYSKGDEFGFMAYVDAFEGAIKNFTIEGRISESQQKDLFRVIGLC